MNILRGLYPGWRVVGATLVGMSSSPGPYAFAALGVFMLPLSEEFGWSRGEISFAATVLTVATALCSPLVGRVVDTIGAQKVLLFSLVALGTCMAALGTLISEVWHLYVLYGLIGSVAVGSNSLPYMRVISAWFNRNRGLAIGIGIGGIGIGYAYVPLLVQGAVELGDWRYGFLALSAFIFFISLPVLFIWFRNTPADAGVSDESEQRLAIEENIEDVKTAEPDSRQVFRSATFWLLAAIFVMLSFVLNGTLTHLVPMLIDKGITPEKAAVAASLVGVLMLVSRVGIGLLVDRFFAPRVAMLCFSLSMVGLVLFAATDATVLMFIGAIALGFSLGAEMDLMAYFAGRYFGLKTFGVVYGSLFAAILVGTALGPTIFGVAYDIAGDYVDILTVAIVLNLIAVILTSRLGAFPNFEN